MSIRVQLDAEGNASVSDPANPTTVERSDEIAPEPIAKIGGIRSRYDAETGEVTVIQRGSAMVGGKQPEANSDPLDFAIENGNVIGRGRLTEESIIESPLIGGSMRLKEAIDLGWVLQTPNGYRFVGPDGNFEETQTQAQTPKQQTPAADDAISVAGVEGTSSAVDMAHRVLRKDAGTVGYSGLLTAYLSNSDPTLIIEDIARSSGQPASEVRQCADFVFSAYEKSAKQVVAAQGVGNWDAFVQWASQNAPDATEDALRQMVETHSVNSLGKLAKQYARRTPSGSDWTTAQILRADMGGGITSFEKNGVAWLRIPGQGEMTFERARAHGFIRIN